VKVSLIIATLFSNIGYFDFENLSFHYIFTTFWGHMKEDLWRVIKRLIFIYRSVSQPGSRHPLWQKNFGGTPKWVNYYFEVPLVIIIVKFHKEYHQMPKNPLFGGTPSSTSWHPCVPQHPGWEPLIYRNNNCCRKQGVSVTKVFNYFIPRRQRKKSKHGVS